MTLLLLDENFQEAQSIVVAHGSLAATTRHGMRMLRRGRVLGVTYHSNAGLAANGTNFFTCNLMNGATNMATGFSTAAVALVADAVFSFTLNANEALRVFAAGDTIGPLYTRAGTATLLDGTLTYHVRYF